MKTMTYRALCALFLMVASGVACADDAWTPSAIKSGVNADVFANPTALAMSTGYVLGVVQAIQSVQNLGIIPHYICPPAMTTANVISAINATDTSPFTNTNAGGAMFIFTAVQNVYPCQ